MPSAKYDAVVIGGGHHGTIIACYLQKAGLRTAVFERWHELGGGACGEELPLPGFIMNPCAHWTRFYAHPAYYDFKLYEYGLTYIFPEYSQGWIFPDGKFILGKPIFPVVDKLTGKSEFSEKNALDLLEQIREIDREDAITVEKLIEKFKERWRLAFRRYRFTGPEEWGEEDPLEELLRDDKYGVEEWVAKGTVGEIAIKLFRSPELQTYYMRNMCTSTGLFAHEKPGIYWHIHVLGLMLGIEQAAIVIGGTHSITHALVRAFEDLGGEFFVLSEVEKVIVENGVAKGIRLKNGEEIKAEIVVSDLDINQSLELLGEENVPKEIWEKVKAFKQRPSRIEEDCGYDRTHVLWGDIAFLEPPKYQQHPDLAFVPRLHLGPADPQYFLSGQFQKERWEKGIADQLYLVVAPDSQWDPTRAPRGRALVKVEDFTCPWYRFTEMEWLRIKKEAPIKFIKEWGKYAENVNMENFLEAWIGTPDDVVNRNPCLPTGGWGGLTADANRLGRRRPIPELSNYRLCVKNYYLCSSAAHSAHGIGRGSSYNCYKIIAQDLNLRYRPWE